MDTILACAPDAIKMPSPGAYLRVLWREGKTALGAIRRILSVQTVQVLARSH
ncbi:MAG TPA: hypothetical protein VMJ11_24650 [Paraburkholderia sp.]|uniref:hypothetical protein n=1 Tax=Paraburkholderia sp. TaxID=1926495 RepID=UPI002D07CD85|nr:hypothetical protein [Paraburkholderia sp.]HTR09788.1 hypothetical protein [Paraburkholderia sp.]